MKNVPVPGARPGSGVPVPDVFDGGCDGEGVAGSAPKLVGSREEVVAKYGMFYV